MDSYKSKKLQIDDDHDRVTEYVRQLLRAYKDNIFDVLYDYAVNHSQSDVDVVIIDVNKPLYEGKEPDLIDVMCHMSNILYENSGEFIENRKSFVYLVYSKLKPPVLRMRFGDTFRKVQKYTGIPVVFMRSYENHDRIMTASLDLKHFRINHEGTFEYDLYPPANMIIAENFHGGVGL